MLEHMQDKCGRTSSMCIFWREQMWQHIWKSFRSATTPAAAAATPTIVDVHWPDDAAVNALCLHEQHEKYLKNIKHIVWQTLFLCLCPMSLTSLWLCPFMSFRIAWYTVRLNDTVLEILGKQVNLIKLGVVSFTNPLAAGSQVRPHLCLSYE